MNRVFLYLLGTLLVIAGLAYVASMMGVATEWIIVGSAIILGIGIMSAATSAKGAARTNVVVDE